MIFLDKMNRLIARPVVQLARRPLISSAETGGHAWYRTGFTAFKSHPSIFRYLGKFNSPERQLEKRMTDKNVFRSWYYGYIIPSIIRSLYGLPL